MTVVWFPFFHLRVMSGNPMVLQAIRLAELVGIHSATVQFAKHTVVIPVPRYNGTTSTCSERSARFEEVVSDDDDDSDSSSDWTRIVSRNKKIKTRLVRSPQGT
jgi:hypothetical protein